MPKRKFSALVQSSQFLTAPIYVSILGAPPLRSHFRAKEIASSWLARLVNMEERLSDKNSNYFIK
jgi:hypothetical protein